MTFQLLLSRLRELLREKVRNGHLTERGLARRTGVSQPHLHNILKGIRALPPDLADQLLEIAGFTLPSIMGFTGPTSAWEPPIHLKGLWEDAGDPGMEGGFAALRLGVDPPMEPRFQFGDMVYYRLDAAARSELDPRATYLVYHRERLLVRYLRMGGQRLYLVSEDSLQDPVRWDYVSLAGRHILEIVRGRIVWICRKVEGAEAREAEKTRRDDRRAG